MNLKYLFLIYLFLYFQSCKSGNTESYHLVRIDSINLGGGISTKYFINTQDSSKRMEVYYWDNGNIMTKSYFYNKMKIGDWEFFSLEGKLQHVMKYRKNKLVVEIKYDTLGNIINND